MRLHQIMHHGRSLALTKKKWLFYQQISYKLLNYGRFTLISNSLFNTRKLIVLGL